MHPDIRLLVHVVSGVRQEDRQSRHPSSTMASTTGDNQPSAGASMDAKVVPDRNTTAAPAPRVVSLAARARVGDW